MTTETIHNYPVSRDYELLADLVLAGPVFCFTFDTPNIVICHPSECIEGRIIYETTNNRWTIYATKKPEFIKQCGEVQLAFVVPGLTPRQQTDDPGLMALINSL